jgi:hypothetical protein
MFGKISRWAMGFYVLGFIAAGSMLKTRALSLAFLVTAGTMRDIRIARR